ncbi:hypothetical protein GQX74_008375 [Glossina fuscipes]|nr:hypothetical protein GQX74_008375 [Glossina fuscipes]
MNLVYEVGNKVGALNQRKGDVNYQGNCFCAEVVFVDGRVRHPTKHFSKVLGKRTATATAIATTTTTTTATTTTITITTHQQQQRNQQQLLGVECKVVKQAKQTKTFVRPVEPATLNTRNNGTDPTSPLLFVNTKSIE